MGALDITVMKMKWILSSLALCGAVFASAAPHNWHLESTYNYSLDQSWLDAGVKVTNMIVYTEGGSVDDSYGWGSTSWAFTSDFHPITNTFDTDWFNVEAAEPTVKQSLLIGIVQDLPNDAPGQKHVVLFMDTQAAALSNHIAWGTLFRNTLEENVIDDIELATSGQDFPIIDPAFDRLSEFTHGDGTHGILGPGGVEHSIFFGPNADFSIVAFSDGQILGSGTSTVNTTFRAVPEPASMAAMGMGLLALARRRRK